MFCVECGNNLPDYAKFCNKCGTQVLQNAQAEAQPTAPQQVQIPEQHAGTQAYGTGKNTKFEFFQIYQSAFCRNNMHWAARSAISPRSRSA